MSDSEHDEEWQTQSTKKLEDANRCTLCHNLTKEGHEGTTTLMYRTYSQMWLELMLADLRVSARHSRCPFCELLVQVVDCFGFDRYMKSAT